MKFLAKNPSLLPGLVMLQMSETRPRREFHGTLAVCSRFSCFRLDWLSPVSRHDLRSGPRPATASKSAAQRPGSQAAPSTAAHSRLQPPPIRRSSCPLQAATASSTSLPSSPHHQPPPVLRLKSPKKSSSSASSASSSSSAAATSATRSALTSTVPNRPPPLVGSYTLSGVQIDKVRLTKHKVELEGARYALHFLGALPYEERRQDPSSASRSRPRRKCSASPSTANRSQSRRK
jgi:hypothetical protein